MTPPPCLRGRRLRRHAAAAFAVLAVALLVAACPSGGGAKASRSVQELKQGRTEVSLVQAQSALAVGPSRFVFGLVPVDKAPLVGGSPELWFSQGTRAPAAGPVRARWVAWSPRRSDSNDSPPDRGYFVADVTVPSAGNWTFLARAAVGGRRLAGVAIMPVTDKPVAGIGTKALSEPTPVADTPEEAVKIDTRDPPAPMHYVSLDAALASGLPTVLVFATPLLCTSRMCGPVVDEVLSVYDRIGRARANFVDVEIYPERDAGKPTAEYLRWGFESEPWVLVIDKTGTIRGRFEGPVVAPEIDAALAPLLLPA